MKNKICNFNIFVVFISFVFITCFLPFLSFAGKVPPVTEKYKKYFEVYADNRSIWKKALNAIGLEIDPVGRSFALIAGISSYPSLAPPSDDLEPAAEDLRKLTEYLKKYEYFDEIILLESNHRIDNCSEANLDYFLLEYLPERLQKFPKSRFLFAFSGHGSRIGEHSYLLLKSSKNLNDLDNMIPLLRLRKKMNHIISTAHHTLILLNSCYSGELLNRQFGYTTKYFLPIHSGAHAITAGGSNEVTWAASTLGTGSVFFEKLFHGLKGVADIYPKQDNGHSGDGVITVDELATYLKNEIKFFSKHSQNPMFGPIGFKESKGGFFFLNRDILVEKGLVQEWEKKDSVQMGAERNLEFNYAITHYNEGNYEQAFPLFEKAAELGNTNAMFALAYMYQTGRGIDKNDQSAVYWYKKSAEKGKPSSMLHLGIMHWAGRGVNQNDSEAVKWYKKAAELGNVTAMVYLGYMYETGQGVSQNFPEAIYWYTKAEGIGDENATLSLGFMYQAGLGVEKNLSRAQEFYKKASSISKPDYKSLSKTFYGSQEGAKNYFLSLYYATRGGINVKIGNYEKAINDLDKAINLGFEPIDWTYGNRAFAFYVSGQYNQAISDCLKAIALNPNRAWYHSVFGYVKYRQQKYQEAIEYFSRAIELSNRSIPSYFAHLGVSYRLVKNYKKSISNLNRAIELNFEPIGWVYANRGSAYYSLKKYSKAINDLTTAIRKNPNDAWAYEIRALAYYELGKYRLHEADKKKLRSLRN